MTNPTFADLGLSSPILAALRKQDYQQPTPIPAQTIPILLEGRDVLGIAQTGTGKTAAFALPILDLLAESRRPAVSRSPVALVLAPTRELANQIGRSFLVYGHNVNVRHTVVHGGVAIEPQIQKLRRGVHVLIATPGRLLDLMNQGHVDLVAVEIFVLDEADRMLDMGFLPDVKRIMKNLSADRQSVMFSATMPREVEALAHDTLRKPKRVDVAPPASTVPQVEQQVYLVERQDKRDLLDSLLRDDKFSRVIVFTRTKHMADRLVKRLTKDEVVARVMHGNKSQSARDRALGEFGAGKARVLIATDVAARGIDVRGITHVINFELPNVAEDYVHRIGRTARAGAAGIAISFCDSDERPLLEGIEKLLGARLTIIREHAFQSRIPYRSEQAPGSQPGSTRGAPKANGRPKANQRVKANSRPKANGRPKADERAKPAERSQSRERPQRAGPAPTKPRAKKAKPARRRTPRKRNP